MARRQVRATEVDAYIFIKANLRDLQWDTLRNPERTPAGQVWTQVECLSNPEIQRLFGPNTRRTSSRFGKKALWVIEAKRSHGQLAEAVQEAEDYANKLNQSETFNMVDHFWRCRQRCRHLLDSHAVFRRPALCPRKDERRRSYRASLALSVRTASQLVRSSPNLDNPPIDEKLFIALANQINEILHLGAINPHQRASVVAALLLSKLSETGPNIDERDCSILIGDINSRVRSVLVAQGKPEFESIS